MRSRLFRIPLWPCLLLCASVALGGCQGGAKEATVEGKVTVGGTPANGGFVAFTGATGPSISGQIQPDGTYRAAGVPVGAVKVSVTPPPQMPPGVKLPSSPAGMPGASTEKSVPIPTRYTKPETSGLTTTLNGGTNHYDVTLESK